LKKEKNTVHTNTAQPKKPILELVDENSKEPSVDSEEPDSLND
jgi:hypothetical protein